MIFGRFIDLGVWTGAIESLVFTCGVLLLLACLIRLVARIALYAVRALVRLKAMCKAMGNCFVSNYLQVGGSRRVELFKVTDA